MSTEQGDGGTWLGDGGLWKTHFLKWNSDSKHHRDCRQVNGNKTTSQTDQLRPPLPCPCSCCFRLNCSFSPPYFRTLPRSWMGWVEWMERNANLQISKEILRNQCEKVTQQTWRDWRSRWRNRRKGVRGPQWPCEIFQIVSKWQNLKLIHDWIQFRWAF